MKIVFQGDSITDWGRDREDPHKLGGGYPVFAAQYTRQRHPDTEFEFVNLGISGNQTKDLVARWQQDCIDLAPDVLSIMIGINDVWHHAAQRDWVPDEVFEANYRTILTAVKEKTHAKIIIFEPYLLPSPDKDFFREDLDPKIQIVRRLAREFADVYVPTDGLLASRCLGKDATRWSGDGVHPNGEGAQLIGSYWADALDSLL